MAAHVAARDAICGTGWSWNGRVCVRSGWYHWGRWILAGALLLAGLLFFIAFSIFLKRRQRRRAAAPMHATGWLGGSKDHHAPPPPPPPPQYPPPPGAYEYPQPPYASYPAAASHGTGETFSPADGYYAGQQYGVQPPPGAYQPQGYPPPK